MQARAHSIAAAVMASLYRGLDILAARRMAVMHECWVLVQQRCMQTVAGCQAQPPGTMHARPAGRRAAHALAAVALPWLHQRI